MKSLREWWRILTRRAPGGGEAPPTTRPRDRGPGSQPPIQRTGLGLLLIAVGRREGLEDFGNTPDAYLTSLAPLIAFALVSCVMGAAAGHVLAAGENFFMLLCWWLAPAVISHPISRVWGRADAWPRYANIFNWSQMLMILAVAAATTIAKAAIAAGLPPQSVLRAGLVLLTVYAVWFHWFVARGTLQLSRWRTVLLLLAVAVGTKAIVSVPLLATGRGLPAFVLP